MYELCARGTTTSTFTNSVELYSTGAILGAIRDGRNECAPPRAPAPPAPPAPSRRFHVSTSFSHNVASKTIGKPCAQTRFFLFLQDAVGINHSTQHHVASPTTRAGFAASALTVRPSMVQDIKKYRCSRLPTEYYTQACFLCFEACIDSLVGQQTWRKEQRNTHAA